MRYITKCAKYRRSKVDHASKIMTSLAIDNAARDSMMHLTDQNRFTRSLSGGYKMTNGSRVRIYSLRMEGEAIKESVVRESTAETRSR